MVKHLTEAEVKQRNLDLTGFEDPNSDEITGEPGGCIGEARDQVSSVFSVRSTLTEELIGLDRQVRNDPQVLEAKQGWAACMKSRGLWVPDDLSLGTRAIVDSGSAITDSELVTYIEQSDECTVSSGLLDTELAVRRASELAFIERHSDILVKR